MSPLTRAVESCWMRFNVVRMSGSDLRIIPKLDKIEWFINVYQVYPGGLPLKLTHSFRVFFRVSHSNQPRHEVRRQDKSLHHHHPHKPRAKGKSWPESALEHAPALQDLNLGHWIQCLCLVGTMWLCPVNLTPKSNSTAPLPSRSGTGLRLFWDHKVAGWKLQHAIATARKSRITWVWVNLG
jgi:hypothetical protein